MSQTYIFRMDLRIVKVYIKVLIIAIKGLGEGPSRRFC